MNSSYIFDKITIKRMFFLLLLFTISIAWGYYFGESIYKPIPIEANTRNMTLDTSVFLVFKKIFFNNYFAAIMLVFVGYFTGGIGTVVLIIFDGISFGFKLRYLNLEKLGGINGFWERLIFHTPLEVFAFILMGSIGLHSSKVILRFIKTQEIILDTPFISHKLIYQYLMGTFLLFLAALIESMESKFF